MITMHLFFEHMLIPGIFLPMPVAVDVRASKCGVGNRMVHHAAESMVEIEVDRKHPNATVCAYSID
jgi:hypothetical protein